MITILALVLRRADLSRAQFREYYDVQHRRLFQEITPPSVMSGITRYVQHHAVQRSSPDTESPWDCITEMTFVDRDAMRRWGVWYQGEDGRALRDDELAFMQRERTTILLTEPQ